MEREIEHRALIAHECAVEHRVAGMAAVGRDHRVAARDCGHLARRGGTECRIDGAIEAAAALEQEAAVPVIRQCKLEPEAIGDAVHALAQVDHTFDLAVARNGGSDRGRKRVWTHGAGRRIGHAPGAGDSKIVAGERESNEPAAAVGAGCLWSRPLLSDRGCRSGCGKRNERHAGQGDADLHEFIALRSPTRAPSATTPRTRWRIASHGITRSC